MIIDVHNHIGRDPAYDIRQSAEELLDKMHVGGIDRAVIFPLANVTDLEKQNDLISDAVDRAPHKFIGFALVNPWNEAETRRVVEYDWVKGVEVDVEIFSVNLVAPKVHASLEAALERDLPVFLNSDHPMSRVSTNMAEWVEAVAVKYPDLRIITRPTIPGIGAVAKHCPNVFFEVSAMHADLMLTRSTSQFGAHRFLLGSDSPKEHPYVKRVLIETAQITDHQKRMILGDNADRILNGSK